MKIEKIGIFGGSFNPIHIGHLIMAQTLSEEFDLDKVIFIPVGVPSHRENILVSGEERLQMVKLAVEGNERFVVSDIEINSKDTSYTIDTLMKIKDIYGWENDYFEIIGEDSADYLHKWKNYEMLLQNATFLVFRRAGYNYVPKSEKIILCETPYIEVSSTKIREKILSGKRIRYLVTESVENYIYIKHLYRQE
jgi:nicotinate-nucleotide adenylyltransferase